MLESIHLSNSINGGNLIFLILSISLIISLSIIIICIYFYNTKPINKRKITIAIKRKYKELNSCLIKTFNCIKNLRFPTIEFNLIFFIWNIFVIKKNLDSLPLIMWVADKDNKLIAINKTYAKILNIKDKRYIIKNNIQIIQKNELSAITTEKIRLKTVVNGSRYIYEVTKFIRYNKNCYIAIDVTNREDQFEILNKQVLAHQHLLDKITTAVAIFSQEKKINFYNEAYVKLWRINEEWLQSNPSDIEILDYLRNKNQIPDQIDYKKWRSDYLKIYEFDTNSEEWWHTPDGKSIRLLKQPNPIGGVTYLYEDLTEKLNLQSDYNTLYTIQKQTIENLYEGIALFGTDGKLKLYNPSFAKLWNLEINYLDEGPHIESIINILEENGVNKDLWSNIYNNIISSENDRVAITGEIKVKNDKTINYRSVILPDSAVLYSFNDITDKTKVEDALREKNKALIDAGNIKNTFMGHISYELRAPLTNIIGFSEILSNQNFGKINKKQADYLNDIQISSKELHSLIDDILDLTAIDSGGLKLNYENIKIQESLDIIKSDIHSTLGFNNIKIIFDIDNPIQEIEMDKYCFQKIIRNLLTTTINSSPPNNKIELKIYKKNNHIEIVTYDQWQGIATIINPISTKTDNNEFTATGIGLSIIKRFVEIHNGEISIINNNNNDFGVRIRLPIKRQNNL
jgi:signal transduction histidine kinase